MKGREQKWFIRVDRHTLMRLRKLKRKNETYDDLLWRLIKDLEEKSGR